MRRWWLVDPLAKPAFRLISAKWMPGSSRITWKSRPRTKWSSSDAWWRRVNREGSDGGWLIATVSESVCAHYQVSEFHMLHTCSFEMHCERKREPAKGAVQGPGEGGPWRSRAEQAVAWLGRKEEGCGSGLGAAHAPAHEE